MREYVGPTSTVYEVVFVPGDPPRLAGATNTAVYLWDLDRAEPAAVLSWDEPAQSVPLLAVSPDGRWLAAGPIEHPRAWDLTTTQPGGPVALSVPGLLAATFPDRDGRMAVIYRAKVRNGTALRAGRLPMAARTRKPGRPTDLELYPELELYVRALDPVNYRQPARAWPSPRTA
jgi:WD40 repeat protein